MFSLWKSISNSAQPIQRKFCRKEVKSVNFPSIASQSLISRENPTIHPIIKYERTVCARDSLGHKKAILTSHLHRAIVQMAANELLMVFLRSAACDPDNRISQVTKPLIGFALSRAVGGFTRFPQNFIHNAGNSQYARTKPALPSPLPSLFLLVVQLGAQEEPRATTSSFLLVKGSFRPSRRKTRPRNATNTFAWPPEELLTTLPATWPRFWPGHRRGSNLRLEGLSHYQISLRDIYNRGYYLNANFAGTLDIQRCSLKASGRAVGSDTNFRNREWRPQRNISEHAKVPETCPLLS